MNKRLKKIIDRPKVTQKRRLVFSSDEDDSDDEDDNNKESKDKEGEENEEAGEGALKKYFLINLLPIDILSKKGIFGSDSDSDAEGDESEKKESTIMADIFGEDSDQEAKDDDKDAADIPEGSKLPDSDEDEPKFLRIEEGSDVERRESDFDLMMQKKRAEKRRKRRRKDGSIDLISDADDQIKNLVDLMVSAANVGFIMPKRP